MELEHSLLQKAVRRGNVELVEKVFNYLISKGYFKWLKNRLAVIAYEECWPFGAQLYDDKSQSKLLEQYKKLTLTEKNKDAAGLATLAFKHYKNQSRYSWLVGDKIQNKAIETIANAIETPAEFWKWIKEENSVNYRKHQGKILSAEKAIAKCEYDVDKAMVYAAAYFYIKDKVPQIPQTTPNNDPDFPYWIAIDKHTTIGKHILEEVSEREGTGEFVIGLIAFYMEGSECHKLVKSPYWDLAKEWEMKNRGYALASARIKWDTLLKPVFIDRTKSHVQILLKDINEPIIKDSGDQIPLF